MANIKKSVCTFALSATVLLCSCENINSEPPDSTADVTRESEETDENYLSATSDTGYSANPACENGNPVTEYDSHTFVPEKWNDDISVPKEWIPIYTTEEALAHFNEIVVSDCLGDSVSNIVLSLVNKNVLFFETLYGKTFEIDWDTPRKAEDFGTVLYPITTPYFTTLDSIYELAFSTYNSSVAEQLLFGTNEEPRVLFTEIDGCLYVNPDYLSKWTHDPFYPRSYVEITDESEDHINFILHYPDYEGLNEPNEYQYFYYNYNYTATYNDGTWLLNSLVLDNNVLQE